MNSNVKKNISAVNGLKWSAIERICSQGIQLLLMIVLARQLGPGAFGLIGMLTIFITIGQVFIDSGFSAALIRKNERTESDYATVFYFNMTVAILFYAVLFFCAPFIAEFYKRNELIELTRVLGLTIIISAFIIVQRIQLSVILDFKTQAISSLSSVIISGGCALLMAYNGFGVWSLVIQTITMGLVNLVILNIYNPWLPKRSFSKKSFHGFFSFGSRLLISSLIDSIYTNIYLVVIGKSFSASTLGQFTQANLLSNTPAMTLTTVVQRVTYPLLSNVNNAKGNIDEIYLRILRLTAAAVFPVMFLLAIIAKPFVVLFLGQQWEPVAELMSILCIGYCLYPVHAINLNLLQVKGRTDLFLKLEIIKKTLITVILIVTIPFGVKIICIGIFAQYYISLLINTYYTGKLSSLSAIAQIKALLPIWLMASISSAISWFLIPREIFSELYQIIG
ncbi:O123/O186 family O-antigen flippase, partial [Escherichia coli]|nr:O123/O186 family O-antigen flippase [Escherichia coli]EFC8779317.1 O123/O186 family O-antigen flippase [Escherichia coli]EIH0669463.1 O123/O186 family O-antigen flippase [Escherichia coli]